MKTFSCLILLVLLTSCVSYRHEYVNQDGSKDVTRFGAFIYVGSASKIRSATKFGTNYTRSVSLGAIEGKGDTEFIQALAAGIAAGLADAAKKGAGVP